MKRSWMDATGRRWTVRAEEDALVFTRGDRRHSVSTPEAGRLDSLSDARIGELFEEEVGIDRERGPDSPSAPGRQTAPHGDPTDYGPPDEQ